MVATRVADERGEALGQTVGYRVMLDKVGGPDCSLIYATTGIILKDLTNVDPASLQTPPLTVPPGDVQWGMDTSGDR